MEFEKIKERYSTHILTEIVNTDTVKVFDFRRKDGSGHCYQRWIINRGTLIVTGDNYDAIYRWNDSSISLEFLANCNLGYFNSKCLADKDGSQQKTYCEETAETFLKELACDHIYDVSDEIEIKEKEWREMNLDSKLNAVKEIICRELDIEEYEVERLFYHERIQDAYDFLTHRDNEFMFGSDAWELSSSLEILTMTPKSHLAALRVAYEKYPNAF